MPSAASRSMRLAELLAVLSLGADLGMGQPMEHAMRQCVIALRMAERLGLDADDRAVVYFVSLIAWVGCHIDAYEQAKWFGDDLALKGDFRRIDTVGIRPLGYLVTHIGAGRRGLSRAAVAARFVSGGMRESLVMLENHWYAADQLAGDLGLRQEVRDALSQTFERWDGKGAPSGCQGEEIRITARIVNLADVLEVHHQAGGPAAAVEVARQRSGTQFDPALSMLVAREAPGLFAGLDAATSWDTIINAEPALGPPLPEDRLEEALEAIGDYTDLKSPYTLGHARQPCRGPRYRAPNRCHPPAPLSRPCPAHTQGSGCARADATPAPGPGRPRRSAGCRHPARRPLRTVPVPGRSVGTARPRAPQARNPSPAHAQRPGWPPR
jgi:hypothetical protein